MIRLLTKTTRQFSTTINYQGNKLTEKKFVLDQKQIDAIRAKLVKDAKSEIEGARKIIGGDPNRHPRQTGFVLRSQPKRDKRLRARQNKKEIRKTKEFISDKEAEIRFFDRV